MSYFIYHFKSSIVAAVARNPSGIFIVRHNAVWACCPTEVVLLQALILSCAPLLSVQWIVHTAQVVLVHPLSLGNSISFVVNTVSYYNLVKETIDRETRLS